MWASHNDRFLLYTKEPVVFHDDGEFLLQGLEVVGVLAEAVSFVVHEDGNVFHV